MPRLPPDAPLAAKRSRWGTRGPSESSQGFAFSTRQPRTSAVQYAARTPPPTALTNTSGTALRGGAVAGLRRVLGAAVFVWLIGSVHLTKAWSIVSGSLDDPRMVPIEGNPIGSKNALSRNQ